jgi:hypothetical protein
LTWEYKAVLIATTDPAELTARLNALGDAGWELAGVCPEPEGQWAAFYFKRPAA